MSVRLAYGLSAAAALGCAAVGSEVATNAALTIAALAAAGATTAGALRSDLPRRRPWAILAASTWLWLAGQLIWDVQVAVSTPVFPAAGDVFWLLNAVALCAAAVGLRAGETRVRRVLGLDALAVLVGVAALALGWLYEPIARSQLGGAAAVVAVGYALLYGAAIVLWVEAIASTPGARGRTAPLAVLAGVVLNGIAWIAYGAQTLASHAVAAHGYDVLWVVGQLALGAGPLLARRGEPLRAPGPLEQLRRRALLPAAAFVALVGTTIAFGATDRPLGARIALQVGLLALGGVLVFRNRIATRIAERIWNERNVELEAFAHSASHDLKAPLVSIQGLASSLERTNGTRLDERGALYLERIQANAVSMQALVDDLLLFARVGVDRPYGSIDADAIVRAAVDDARATGAAVELLTPIPSVVAHPVRFRQALANLIDNGVRYGRSVVRVSARALPDCVEVAVEDDGPGIDAGERERVFELFARGRSGLEQAPDGTGFGLALVRRIAVMSGGSVRYEPAAPSGSRFVLSLPKGSA